MNRRRFLGAAGAATFASTIFSPSAVLGATDAEKRYVKSLMFGMVPMLPAKNSVGERLQMAKDAGFEAVEIDTIYEAEKQAEMKAAAEKAGLKIEAIVCNKHWSHPLSDPDTKKVDVCMESMRTSLANARDFGAGVVLLVPAVVNAQVRYKDAYERSQARIRELIPVAKEMNAVIAIEDVWNKFLLSPLEFRRYVEEFDSPHVRAWFDVGNIVTYGYPEDWIRTLRELIVRVHIKDFSREAHQFRALRQGDVNWPEVMKAFDEVGYKGYIAAEVQGGDTEFLRKQVVEPMELILAGK